MLQGRRGRSLAARRLGRRNSSLLTGTNPLVWEVRVAGTLKVPEGRHTTAK